LPIAVVFIFTKPTFHLVFNSALPLPLCSFSSAHRFLFYSARPLSFGSSFSAAFFLSRSHLFSFLSRPSLLIDWFIMPVYRFFCVVHCAVAQGDIVAALHLVNHFERSEWPTLLLLQAARLLELSDALVSVFSLLGGISLTLACSQAVLSAAVLTRSIRWPSTDVYDRCRHAFSFYMAHCDGPEWRRFPALEALVSCDFGVRRCNANTRHTVARRRSKLKSTKAAAFISSRLRTT